MKIWVVGENTPNPKKWSIWSEVGIIIAETKEDALRLDGRGNSQACEIPMNEEQVLIQLHEPDFGEDL